MRLRGPQCSFGSGDESEHAEDLAKAELQRVQVSVLDATAKSQQALLELQAALDEVEDNLSRIAGDKGIFAYKNQQSQGENKSTMGGARHPVESTALSGTVGVPLPTGAVLKLDFEVKKLSFKGNTPEAIKTRKMLREASDFINQFYFIDRDKFQQLLRAQELIRKAADEDGPMELGEADFETLKQILSSLLDTVKASAANARNQLRTILTLLTEERPEIAKVVVRYRTFRDEMKAVLRVGEKLDTRVRPSFEVADKAIQSLSGTATSYQAALQKARLLRRPLDENKLLDLLVDDTEDKFIEQLEGTRAHTANVDNYIKAITTALDDDFNTQFYNPAFRKVREASRLWDVTMGQIETTTVLTNNRSFAKVSPAATMEFDLTKRDIMITEGFKSAKALFDEYGALMNDPSFLALGKLYSGAPSTSQFNTGGGFTAIRNVIPGLPSSPDEQIATQAGPGRKEFGAALEGLIPDPAIYKFETGTGFEIRPVLAPDGQAVVFNFQYLFTTDVREPVRADEKHLGRVKRHFVHTDVQLSNFELREVSKYMVALKAARTAKGVPLLEDVRSRVRFLG